MNLIFVVAISCMAFQADPIREFLDHYPSMVRGEFKVTMVFGPDPRADQFKCKRVIEVVMDPPRWRIFERESSSWIENGKLVNYALQGEGLTPAVGQIVVSGDYLTGRADTGVWAKIKPLPANELKAAGCGHFRFAIDGANLVNNQMGFADLLSQSKVTLKNEELNGIPVVVVLAVSKWGKATIWLDPKRQHLPVRFLLEKTAEDLINEGEKVKNIKHDFDGRPTAMSSFVEQFDTTKIQSVGGRLMVTGFIHRETTRYADNTIRQDAYQIDLSEIKMVDKWDKDPFVLKTIVPNGTRVTVADDRPIEYVWMDGKIVKAVDQNVVAQVAATEFVPPSRSATRWPWIVGVLLVIGCLVGIWAFKSRKKP